MKQITLSLKNGKIEVIDIPIPSLEDNSVLVKNRFSLISSGTEGSLINFGESNYLKKILNQKDKVQLVLEKLKRDGLFSTFNTVSEKLNNSLPLGYCSVGEVIKSTSKDFVKGQRVICNGPHAEYVSVPTNLCHNVPDNVNDLDAVFTVIASISLQGIRSLDPKIGDKVVVFGLGLIGQITMQLLNASGCDVIGLDINSNKVDHVKKSGYSAYKCDNIANTQKFINYFSSQVGVDGVIICTHTNDNSIINQSASFCRPEGKIILVGTADITINRDSFYKKQISFKVSSSYGPGRYDKKYELGQDYPIGFVRWTANRNFGEILRLLSTNKIKFQSLISEKYEITDFQKAYDSLKSDNLASVFDYGKIEKENNTQKSQNKVFKRNIINTDHKTIMNTCFLGAGNFSSRFLIPLFKKEGFILHTVISSKGINANRVADKYKFSYVSSSFDDVLKDKSINNIVISTPHYLHSDQLIKSLLYKKKNIYIDKPLAINRTQLNEIIKVKSELDYNPNIIIGFNRKFSPLIVYLKNRLDVINSPKFINMNINAGFIDNDHWINDKSIGGGRLIGEGCHFIDLSIFLINSELINSEILGFDVTKKVKEESFIINLSFRDGSIVNINYLSNGSKSFMKEKIDIYANGSNYIIEDFKKLKVYGDKSIKDKKLFIQDKGIRNLIKEFKKNIINEDHFNFENQIKVSEVIIRLSEKINSDD
jgi:threonine dehydrogenase-like Zn-dependent dehydrogenase/predicted dehydrogenase